MNRHGWDRASIAGLDLDFWKFWAGQAISTLGSSFTGFALPLLIFQLTGSALNLSISMAVSYVPSIVFGLPVGAWVDRMNRKRVMTIVNLLLGASVASVPLMAATGQLTVWWIYAMQFAAATFRVFFSSASFAAIPSLVPKEQLVPANGRIQASYSLMSVIGPILAGGLAAFVPISSLLVVDAISYLAAAGALLLVHRSFNPVGGRPPAKQSIRRDVVEGLSFLFGHPVLRNISIMMALVNFVSMTVAGQLVFFAKVQLHATNQQVGLLFSANAVGILLLSLAAGPLRRHWPFSRVALGLLEIQGFVVIILAQFHNFWAVLPLIALWQGLGALFTINTTSLRQTLTPNHLLGRVVATSSVLGSAMIPFGGLLGGFAIARTGDVGLIFTVIGALVFLIAIAFSFTALGHAERYLPRDASPGSRREDASDSVRWSERRSEVEDSGGAAGDADLTAISTEELDAVRSGLASMEESAQDIVRLVQQTEEKDLEAQLSLPTLKKLARQTEDLTYHWNEIVNRLDAGEGADSEAAESGVPIQARGRDSR